MQWASLCVWQTAVMCVLCVFVSLCVFERERRRAGRLPIPVTQIVFHSSACDSTFPSFFMLVASSLPVPSSFPFLHLLHPFSLKCKFKLALLAWQGFEYNITYSTVITAKFLLFFVSFNPSCLFLFSHNYLPLRLPLFLYPCPPFCFPHTSPQLPQPSLCWCMYWYH